MTNDSQCFASSLFSPVDIQGTVCSLNALKIQLTSQGRGKAFRISHLLITFSSFKGASFFVIASPFRVDMPNYLSCKTNFLMSLSCDISVLLKKKETNLCNILHHLAIELQTYMLVTSWYCTSQKQCCGDFTRQGNPCSEILAPPKSMRILPLTSLGSISALLSFNWSSTDETKGLT